jgi:hypothetical protein
MAGRLDQIGVVLRRRLPGHAQPAAKGFTDNRLEFATKCSPQPLMGHSLSGPDHHLLLGGSSPNAPGGVSKPDPEPLVSDPTAEGIANALRERRRFHGRNGDGFTHGSFLPAGRILGSLRSILVVPHRAGLPQQQ